MSDQVGNPEDRFSHNEALFVILFVSHLGFEGRTVVLTAPVHGHFLPFTFLIRYENTPMQYTAIFHRCKNDNFQMKNCDIFLIFAQNIDCGYMLEPSQ